MPGKQEEMGEMLERNSGCGVPVSIGGPWRTCIAGVLGLALLACAEELDEDEQTGADGEVGSAEASGDAEGEEETGQDGSADDGGAGQNAAMAPGMDAGVMADEDGGLGGSDVELAGDDAGTAPPETGAREVAVTVLDNDGQSTGTARVFLPGTGIPSEVPMTAASGQFVLPDVDGNYALIALVDDASGEGAGHVLYYEGLSVDAPTLMDPGHTPGRLKQVSGTVTLPAALADQFSIHALPPGALPYAPLQLGDVDPAGGASRSFDGWTFVSDDDSTDPVDLLFATIPGTYNDAWAPVYHGVAAGVSLAADGDPSLDITLDGVIAARSVRFSFDLPGFVQGEGGGYSTAQVFPWAMQIDGQRVQLAESSGRRDTTPSENFLDDQGGQTAQSATPLQLPETTTHVLYNIYNYEYGDYSDTGGMTSKVRAVNLVRPLQPGTVAGITDEVQAGPEAVSRLAFVATPSLAGDSLAWTGSEGAEGVIVRIELPGQRPLRAVLPGDVTALDLRPYKGLLEALAQDCVSLVEIVAVYGLGFSPDAAVDGVGGSVIDGYSTSLSSLGPRARRADSFELQRLLFDNYDCGFGTALD